MSSKFASFGSWGAKEAPNVPTMINEKRIVPQKIGDPLLNLTIFLALGNILMLLLPQTLSIFHPFFLL